MGRDPGDQRRATLRVSDADREQFVEALRRHHAEGRLTTEELAERTDSRWPSPASSSTPTARHAPTTGPATAEPPSGAVRTMPVTRRVLPLEIPP